MTIDFFTNKGYVLAILCTFSIFNLPGQNLKLLLPIGHTDRILWASYSQDGRRIVTASKDKTAKLWDAQTGQLLASFDGHTGAINYVSFNPSNNRIVTASDDGTAKIWNVMTGEVIFSLKGHTQKIRSCVFSPDGNKVATASNDSTIKIWDVHSGNLLFDLKGHNDCVNLALFSPSGDQILSISNDRLGKLWDTKTGVLLFNLKGHANIVNTAGFSPDGQSIVTASYDLKVKIWDVKTGTLKVDVKPDSNIINSVTFDPQGNKILTASLDGTARVLNAHTGETSFVLQHKRNVTSATFSFDGRKILTSSWDNTLKVWDGESGHLLDSQNVNSYELTSAMFSPDSKSILSLSYDNIGKLWSSQTLGLITVLKGHTYEVNSASFSPDDASIVTTSGDSSAKIWNIKTGRLLKVLRDHESDVNDAVFSNDQNEIATSSDDGSINIFDAKSGQLLSRIGNEEDEYDYISFSPDNKCMLSIGNSPNVSVWNFKTGKLKFTITDSNTINSASYSPDGKSIVTSNWKGTIKVWNARNGRHILSITNGARLVTDAKFTLDGKNIIAGTLDGSLEKWTSNNGQLVFNTKIGEEINSVDVSPNDDRILISLNDGTATICDASNGSIIYKLSGHNGAVNTASYNKEGDRILTSSDDNTCILWDKSGKYLYKFFAVDNSDYLDMDSSERFDGSYAALKAMYFVDSGEAIQLDQLLNYSWEPGLVEKIMGYDSDSIIAKPPSSINLVDYIPTIKFLDSGSLKDYRFQIRPGKGGISAIALYVNRTFVDSFSLDQIQHFNGDYEFSFSKEKILPLFIPGVPNKITVIAKTEDRQFQSKGVNLEIPTDLNFVDAGLKSPHLYCIAIGINKYSHSSLDSLNFPPKDAIDFENAVTMAARKFLKDSISDNVSLYLLNSNGRTPGSIPSRNNIRRAFFDVKSKARKNDILLVFMSGHGTTISNKFYFLTPEAVDFELSNGKEIAGISSDTLAQWMINCRAQNKILVLDACYSGQVVSGTVFKAKGGIADRIKDLNNLSTLSGTFILTACASDQSAYEFKLYSQGLLTYNLLNGMQTGGGLKNNYSLDVLTWFNFATEQTTLITKRYGLIQEPRLLGNGAPNMVLGYVDESVKKSITLTSVRPVFTNCEINALPIYIDSLNLGAGVDSMLTARSYTNDFPNVTFLAKINSNEIYQIRGAYTISGNSIRGSAILYKGKQDKGHIDINGKADRMQSLENSIFEQAFQKIRHN